MCLHDITTKLKNSSYNEYEQVVQDFRRIFNNVRLYLKVTLTDMTTYNNIVLYSVIVHIIDYLNYQTKILSAN